MPRQISVLGCQAAYPTYKNPCSGFLLTWDNFDMILDLGYGTLDRLLALRQTGRVDAIVITHDHPDHWLDLHGLFRMLHYGPNPAQRAKTALYCPTSVVEQMRNLEPDVELGSVFDIHTLYDRCAYSVGPFQLSGLLLPHFVPNIGVRLQVISGDERRVVAYTGDTGPSPLLAELGRGADLFIIEATDRAGETERKPSERNLMSSSEAGYWGDEADAQRLLLTHFWPGNDAQSAVASAKGFFRGEILAAKPDLVVQL